MMSKKIYYNQNILDKFNVFLIIFQLIPIQTNKIK